MSVLYGRRNGDKKAVLRICQILCNEKLRRQWGCVKHSTKPRRGGAPTAIRVEEGENGLEYDTQAGVEENAGHCYVGGLNLLVMPRYVQDSSLMISVMSEIYPLCKTSFREHTTSPQKWILIHDSYVRRLTRSSLHGQLRKSQHWWTQKTFSISGYIAMSSFSPPTLTFTLDTIRLLRMTATFLP